MLFYTSSIIQEATTLNDTSLLLLAICSCILICPIMPRFIISVRELYDRDLQHCRWQGVDTGFGVLSHPIASDHAAASAIVFADVVPGQDEAVEEDATESEVIRLETLGDNTCQV